MSFEKYSYNPNKYVISTLVIKTMFFLVYFWSPMQA